MSTNAAKMPSMTGALSVRARPISTPHVVPTRLLVIAPRQFRRIEITSTTPLIRNHPPMMMNHPTAVGPVLGSRSTRTAVPVSIAGGAVSMIGVSSTICVSLALVVVMSAGGSAAVVVVGGHFAMGGASGGMSGHVGNVTTGRTVVAVVVVVRCGGAFVVVVVAAAVVVVVVAALDDDDGAALLLDDDGAALDDDVIGALDDDDDDGVACAVVGMLTAATMAARQARERVRIVVVLGSVLRWFCDRFCDDAARSVLHGRR